MFPEVQLTPLEIQAVRGVLHCESPEEVYLATVKLIPESREVALKVANFLINYDRLTQDNSDRIYFGISLLHDASLCPEQISARLVGALTDFEGKDHDYHFSNRSGTNMDMVGRYHDGFRESVRRKCEEIPGLLKKVVMDLSNIFTPSFFDGVVEDVRNSHFKYEELSYIQQRVSYIIDPNVKRTIPYNGTLISKSSVKAFVAHIGKVIADSNQILQDLKEGLDQEQFTQAGYTKSQNVLSSFHKNIGAIGEDACSKLDKVNTKYKRIRDKPKRFWQSRPKLTQEEREFMKRCGAWWWSYVDS